MSTYATLMVQSDDKLLADRAFNAAWEAMYNIEKSLNFHNPDSDLSYINKHAGKRWVTISNDLYYIITQCLSVSRKTKGYFDITIGSLMKLYGFYRNSDKKNPSRGELKKAISSLGYDYIKLRIKDDKIKQIFFANDKINLDLGAVAKGFAVDKAVSVLKEQGIKIGLVNIGGNIYGLGKKKWKIGVQHPRKKDKIVDTITLKNKGIATSGDYERFFISNKVKVHHLMNPKTGLPATSNIGITVVAPTAFKADIYSTALFFLSEKDIQKIAKEEDLEVIIVAK